MLEFKNVTMARVTKVFKYPDVNIGTVMKINV
jgi:hypothetical protein